MKRKLFTLLLAIGVLMAFQTNAQSRYRILADTSGLAKKFVNDVSRNDSFPKQKKELYRWLSVNEDGKFVVRSVKNEGDTAKFRDELYRDASGVFNLSFSTLDSLNYRFSSGERHLSLDVTGDNAKSYFELVVPDSDNLKKGKVVSFKTTQENIPLRGKGYLVSVPAGSSDIKLDTIEFALVGANKDGVLSLRKFNEFAIYGDSLPYAPYTAYQTEPYNAEEEKWFDPGKLYQSDSFPHFQIYDKDGKGLIDIRRKEASKDTLYNQAENWGHIKAGQRANQNDPHVYTWFDIKLSGDSAIVLYDKPIRLDSIKHFADTLAWQYTFIGAAFDNKPWYNPNGLASPDRAWSGFDTTSVEPNKISPWISRDADSKAVDSSFNVYLRRGEDNQLVFTVKTDSTGDPANDWTNGEPTKFRHGPKKDDGTYPSYYYSIDTLMLSIFPDLLIRFVGPGIGKDSILSLGGIDTLFIPKLNHVPRYVYKNKDDSWRPLYVKLEEVPEVKPAKYVGWQWVKDNASHLSAALQTLTINPATSISTGDRATIINKDDAAAARFLFEKADSIDVPSGGDSHWFTQNHYSYANEVRNFQNSDTVELFYIRHDKKYLTVLDTTEFLDQSISSSTVANTQLGWREKLAGTKEPVRQMFAIVRNSDDESITLLPVASRKWKLDNGKAKYSSLADSLSFNLGIGRYKQIDGINDSVADLGGTWYISFMSKAGETAQKLVIADSNSTAERLWLNVRSPLKSWEGHEAGKLASLLKVTNGKYYRGDSTFIASVTANDIRAHWRIKKIEKIHGEANGVAQEVEDAWKFTPVIDKIHGTSQKVEFSTDTVFAYAVDDDILLIDRYREKALDTIRVSYTVNPEEFSLFDNLDRYVNRQHKPSVAIVLGENNIAFGPKITDNDSIHEASFGRVNSDADKTYLSVYRSRTQLLDRDTLYKEVPYYLFSHKEGNKEYFLNVDENSVRWVALPESLKERLTGETAQLSVKPETYRDSLSYFKFALPRYGEGVYLQALDTVTSNPPRVIRLKGGSNMGLGYEQAVVKGNENKNEGIYGAIDFYNDAASTEYILSWQLQSSGASDEWLSLGSSLFDEDGTASGVLSAVDYAGDYVLGSANSNGTRYGIFSNSTDPGIVALKLKRTDTVAPAEETVIVDKPVYYFILQDGLYLTDNDDEQAGFTDRSVAKRQEFAFSKTGEDSNGYLFGIVSNARGAVDHYLTNRALTQVIFSDQWEDQLSFQWLKREFPTGIQVTGASSAKVYGVAGGVKAANATGAVSIYTIDGRLVTTQAVTSPNQTIAVPAGIYIVRNGAEVAKVIVK